LLTVERSSEGCELMTYLVSHSPFTSNWTTRHQH